MREFLHKLVCRVIDLAEIAAKTFLVLIFAAVLTALLITIGNCAKAGEVQVLLASKHYVENPTGEGWNEINPGIFVSGELGTVGVYRNSVGDPSVAAAIKVFEWRPDESWRLRTDVGFATGYQDMGAHAGIIPLAIGTVSYEWANVHIIPGAVAVSVTAWGW